MKNKFKTINPSNNNELAEYSYLDWSELESALSRCESSYKKWSRLGLDQRLDKLRALKEQIETSQQLWAKSCTEEMGKLLKESSAEVSKCIQLMDFFLENSQEFLKPETINADGIKNEIQFRSLGPLLGIMPWNFPYWQILRFAIPALIAGNTILIKPAVETTGCALLIKEAFNKVGIEDGVFQVVIVEHESVSKLLEDERIRGVSFTGSTRGGREVYQNASKVVRKVVLELGGSDPFIVLSSFDMGKVVDAAIAGRFLNCGQTCIASKRFFLPREISNEFIDAVVSKLKTIKLGTDPMEESSQIAPLFSMRGKKLLDEQVDDARSKGAKFHLDGEASESCYFSPTIVSQIDSSMRIYSEEVFGPVMMIYPYDEISEVVDQVNASEFGLGASIWSNDLESAEKIAEQLNVGALFINSIVKSDPRVPFGGTKNSGFGRELGKMGIREFTNPMSLNVYS